jgi:hypothetical protein
LKERGIKGVRLVNTLKSEAGYLLEEKENPPLSQNKL